MTSCPPFDGVYPELVEGLRTGSGGHPGSRVRSAYRRSGTKTGAQAHPTTVSIQKLCVGQLFCVGAALVAAHPRATTRVAPTAAPALSGYEWSQVGVFLLPPLMHRFTVDTVVGCV